MRLSKQKKKMIVGEYSKHEKDTGSPEVQIAIITERVKYLTGHFNMHVKDHHSRKGLMGLIEKRKKLLKYLRLNDPRRYKATIEKLGLRK